MESSIPVSTKSERRWRSKPLQTSKPSLVLAFFSCFAWLYVAGRLWQDAENRTLLSNLLKRNTAQGPKFLTVEDKLVVLGCKDLERRIVEAEMELTLAKSQGYLKNRLSENGSSGKKMLAVIGVYTGFGSHLKRKVFRGSWMPRGDALKKLEERGVVIRFVIGRSANRGDSLDRNIDSENRSTKDFLILGLIELLERRRSQDSAYIGCMKSGEVVTEEYFRHASGSLLILSKNMARYIDINSPPSPHCTMAFELCGKWKEVCSPACFSEVDEEYVYIVNFTQVNADFITLCMSCKLNWLVIICSASLKSYAHDDTSVGSWMMGVQATYIDDNRLCCSSIKQVNFTSYLSSSSLLIINEVVLTANLSPFICRQGAEISHILLGLTRAKCIFHYWLCIL
ncbi:hypothetical protein DKX38_010677 [Salix brachista]|uniref:Hexosyltransferase n=1 Tax=Salix brachista TaxID=2182728 RepID=A0A5N5MGU2_9ROSI|nr:hypothetical protein DKX38_010677 [Salix brachista]